MSIGALQGIALQGVFLFKSLFHVLLVQLFTGLLTNPINLTVTSRSLCIIVIPVKFHRYSIKKEKR
jgi:hypothetical protein